MNKLLITILILIGNISCFHSSKKSDQNVNCFELFAKQFIPSSIDLSKSINDSFDNCIMLITDYSDIKVKRGVYLVLLKQYLFQLQESNHGFDLIDYRSNSAQKIINIYIKINNLDSAKLYKGGHYGQGLYSHQVYLDVLKDSEMLTSLEIKKTVDKINKLEQDIK